MLKLLIVDDEQIERQALSYIINNSGLCIKGIEEAANGRQAIDRVSKSFPDIVIMDVKMPGINGLEAARQIKLIHPESKIIFLTAYSQFDYAQEAIKIGVEDFIIKPVSNDNIVEVIGKVIKKIETERTKQLKYRETETKLQQVTEYFTNEILSSLIAGDIEADRIGEYIENLNLNFKSGVCAVLTLAKGSIPNREFQDAVGKAVFIINQVVARHSVKYLINHQQRNLNLLLIFEQLPSKAVCCEPVIKEIFADLNKMLSQQIDQKYAIGVSKAFTEINKATNAFFQARIAANNTHDSILFYSSYLDLENQDFKYPLGKEKQLLEKILTGDREGTLTVFSEIWDWILQSSTSDEEISEKTYQFLVIIKRWMIEEFNSDGDQLPNYLNELKEIKLPNDIRLYFKNFLIIIFENIKNRTKAPAASLIGEVCNYIDGNYMKEITLDEISAMVGFSRYYFSKLFKHYQGMNFIDYLTLVRIKKSKEFLKDARLSVKDISYMVGYSDPNYYTSVFKKTEGISPTEFRSKCLSL